MSKIGRKERTEIEADDARSEVLGRAKLNAEAYEDGARAARAKESERSTPQRFAQTRPLLRSWLEGFRETLEKLAPALPAIAAAAVRAPEAVKLPPLALWPKDKPLPNYYHRPPVPCPSCRRLLTDYGGRATVLKWTSGGKARFSCRATKGCPDFTLPVLK